MNIDLHNSRDTGYKYLKDVCDVLNKFNFKKTCFTKTYQSSISVILTNKPKSFQYSSVFGPGFSGITTSLKQI